MLKIGDKVKMTPRGFKFYANLDTAFDMGSVAGSMNSQHFTQAVCEQFAIHGVGVIKSFSDSDSLYIRWDFAIDGMEYHYTHYFENKDVRKLTLLEKIILFLKGSC